MEVELGEKKTNPGLQDQPLTYEYGQFPCG